MKIRIQLGPEHQNLLGPPRIGDVYPVRGGRGLRYGHLNVLVAVHDQSRMCHFLTINSDGEIVGTTSYGTHVIEDRVPIARVEGLEEVDLVMRSL